MRRRRRRRPRSCFRNPDITLSAGIDIYGDRGGGTSGHRYEKVDGARALEDTVPHGNCIRLAWDRILKGVVVIDHLAISVVKGEFVAI